MSTEAKWDVFISYSTKDFDIIQYIVRDLQKRGIRYWLDQEQIRTGDFILETIEKGLRESDAIMPCFSNNQLQSGWSRAEYTAILSQALSGKSAQRIYPLLLDEVVEDELPVFFRNIKCTRYGDTNNYTRFLDDLEKHVSREVQQRLDQSQLHEPTFAQPPKQSQDLRKAPVNENEKRQIRNLIPRFIHDQYQQGNVEGNFEALTMFVDVARFTDMTETLMQYGAEGAEVLAEVMNNVFDLLVQAVYAHGGFISLFAGDAFTAIFPTESKLSSTTTILHVLACVDRIHSLFHAHGIQDTRFGELVLQFKVGLSYGKVNWGILGDKQKTYFFRGEAIEACAAAEKQAERGEIIFDERLAQEFVKIPGVSGRDWKIEKIHTGEYRLRAIPHALQQQLPPSQIFSETPLRQEILAQFLPETILNFKGVGEFRNIVSVFIGFRENLSPEASKEKQVLSPEALQSWGTLLLEQVNAYGGYLSQFDFGDKGNTALCVFGAPVGLEDPIDRALECMLAVRRKLRECETLAELEFRAGITYGKAYTGIVGGRQRCVYSYYSKMINLAARLMATAPWEVIFVSKEIHHRRERFLFRHQGDIEYKGFARPIPTYLLLSRKYGGRKRAFSEQLVGRRQELRQLHRSVTPIFDSKFAGVLYVYGEAGIGKSHLADTLRQEVAETHDINWFTCPVDQIFNKPWNPFITLLSEYFELSPESSEEQNKTHFEDKYKGRLLDALGFLFFSLKDEATERFSVFTRDNVSHLREELLRTKSVIGALLGLHWPDSLWEQLDPKGKHENALHALKTFFLAQSLFNPTVIEIDDGHWLDNDSREFLVVLTRNIEQYTILILSTLRDNDDGSKPNFGLKGIIEQSLHLDYLPESDVKLHAETELQDVISNELHKFLAEKTKGNPFFVQQVLRYFNEEGIITQQDHIWQIVKDTSGVPDSIENILIARLDRLTVDVKEAVKTAAVIGREFEIQVLSAVLKRDLRKNDPILREARHAQIWEQVDQIREIFKHALFRDAAYEMLLNVRRKKLHQITAEAIEILYHDRLEQYFADLALHYENTEIRDKAIEYLEKAGDQAKAQYQNQQAIGFYERLLAQLQHVFGTEEKRIDTLLKKAEILEIIGKWQECQEVCEKALKLSEQMDDKRLIGQANRILGILSRRRGKYDTALTYFEQAIALFETVKYKEGIARALSSMGVVYEKKSDYEAARRCYEQSLVIDEDVENTLDIARNSGNMGIVYDMQGDYKTAMMWYQKSLQIFEKLGEKLEMSRVLNNMGECHREILGDYETAMEYYQKTLMIAEELGDKLQIATILGNIGHVYKSQGKYDRALVSYNKAIALARELESRYILSEYLIGKAEILFVLQHYKEAHILVEEGNQIMHEIGKKEGFLQSNILSIKIDFALGKQDAPCRLKDMLKQTQDNAEIATLHYELWKMNHEEDNWQKAFSLYQCLYESTSNSEYKVRIDEMKKNSP